MRSLKAVARGGHFRLNVYNCNLVNASGPEATAVAFIETPLNRLSLPLSLSLCFSLRHVSSSLSFLFFLIEGVTKER